MTQCEVMLQMLKQAGPHGVTSREFVEGPQIFKYTGRISDLRKQGHVILAERVRDTLYRYILKEYQYPANTLLGYAEREATKNNN